MNETERARLRAELRAMVAENADSLGLAATAGVDLTNRLMGAGALMVGDRPAMPCGTSPIDYIALVLRNDAEAVHLFAAPEKPTHIPAKPASPAKPERAGADVSTPASAAAARNRYRAELDARLAKGNGHA